LTLCKGFVNLLRHDLEQSLGDFAFAVACKTTVGAGDPVEEEEDVEEDGGNHEENRESPDDQGEAHTR
jgi:hypothetical protein